MLRLTQLEEIEGLLLGAGRLVHMQEQRDVDFVAATVGWLQQLEAALESNRLVEAALIAGLRSGVASAAAGNFPPGITTRGQPTRTKVAGLVAGQALQRATEIGAGVVAVNRPRFAEAELVAQRMSAALRSLNLLLPERLTANRTEWLRAVRAIVAGRADLEPAMVHLEGLVGSTDSLIVLDRALGVDAVERPTMATALATGKPRAPARPDRTRRAHA